MSDSAILIILCCFCVVCDNRIDTKLTNRFRISNKQIYCTNLLRIIYTKDQKIMESASPLEAFICEKLCTVRSKIVIINLSDDKENLL